MYMLYIYKNHFAVYLKLRQSIILQFKIKLVKKKKKNPNTWAKQSQPSDLIWAQVSRARSPVFCIAKDP